MIHLRLHGLRPAAQVVEAPLRLVGRPAPHAEGDVAGRHFPDDADDPLPIENTVTAAAAYGRARHLAKFPRRVLGEDVLGVQLHEPRLGPLKDLNCYFPFDPPATREAWRARAEIAAGEERFERGGRSRFQSMCVLEATIAHGPDPVADCTPDLRYTTAATRLERVSRRQRPPRGRKTSREAPNRTRASRGQASPTRRRSRTPGGCAGRGCRSRRETRGRPPSRTWRG
jgi:hypothetical protein